jgi:hypothetical protein
MALKSNLFAGDMKLEAAATSHPAHIMRGATGPHVAKIQAALFVLDGVEVSGAERKSSTYGPSTAAAVLAYKKKRDIVNRSYQSSADDIVGIMTMKAMDDELFARQVNPEPARVPRCDRKGSANHLARHASAVSDDAFEMGALSSGTARALPLGLPGSRAARRGG